MQTTLGVGFSEHLHGYRRRMWRNDEDGRIELDCFAGADEQGSR
jgi:hypothetical protein